MKVNARLATRGVSVVVVVWLILASGTLACFARRLDRSYLARLRSRTITFVMRAHRVTRVDDDV